MNKQAILIIAHNNIWTLKKILSLLDSEFFDIFIHIDSKSKIDFEKELKNICKKSNLFIFKEINVRWADYSLVESELLLLEKASTENIYEYYHLISGVDMPLKTPKEIYEFFHSKKGREFIHFENLKITNKKLDRVKYYYHFIKYSRSSKLFRILEKISIIFQKLICINRTKNNKIQFKSGGQWFSITDNFARYILTNKSLIEKNFKHTFAPDELFIQTLLYNSKYINNLYYNKYDDNYESCMRLIDWQRGNPYTYTIEDFDLLLQSNYLFARKFNENKDKEIIEKLYKHLMSNK